MNTADAGLARFFCRLILGTIFGMAGWWKCFDLTPLGHFQKYFLPYADTWIPYWVLFTLGVTVPLLELAAGALLILGWRVREALITIGCILVIVTYGHLLKEPLFSPMAHIVPRTVLMVAVFLLPSSRDTWTIERLWSKNLLEE